MKLIVGLGNPGKEYAHTKHNAGFWVVDAVSQLVEVDIRREKFNALWMQATYNGSSFLAIKPLTFMNRSGQAVQAFIRYYQIAMSDVLVIVDDVHLSLGTLRIRPLGGAGGHNGVRSIINALATNAFARIRLGIGAPEQQGQLSDFVLSGFSSQAYKTVVSEMVLRARDAVLTWVSDDVHAAMNKYNTVMPPEQCEGERKGDKGGNGNV